MASSPSEFLTFYRLASRQSILRSTRITRSFSTSTTRFATKGQDSHNVISDKGTQQDTSIGSKVGGSREHALDKGAAGDPNIQSEASASGRNSRSQDAGGSATRQKDERNSTAKAKEEHPEAPDTVIGMQDERGGKGV